MAGAATRPSAGLLIHLLSLAASTTLTHTPLQGGKEGGRRELFEGDGLPGKPAAKGGAKVYAGGARSGKVKASVPASLPSPLLGCRAAADLAQCTSAEALSCCAATPSARCLSATLSAPRPVCSLPAAASWASLSSTR